jgi:hypothetical protein
MLSLDEYRNGALSRVFDKARTTAKHGHRVVMFVQGLTGHGEEHWASQGAIALAHFPAGTLAWGHAAGWADDKTTPGGPSHSWSTSLYGSVLPPKEGDAGPLRRHVQLFNKRDVSLLLFGATAAEATAISHQQLRELAYLVNATGGRAVGAATRWAPMWYGGGGDAKTLAWAAQRSVDDIDFLTPWRIVSWQPMLGGPTPLPMPIDACPRDNRAATDAAAELHRLAEVDARERIPDGAVPAALVRLLNAVGGREATETETINAIVHAQLRAVRQAAQQRSLQVAHHWQLVGVPLESIGAIRHPELAGCHACGQAHRFLYHVNAADGAAEEQLVDHATSGMIEAIDRALEEPAAARAHHLLRATMQTHGICVCFKCAAPVLTQRYAARQASNQRASAAQRAACHANAAAPSPYILRRTNEWRALRLSTEVKALKSTFTPLSLPNSVRSELNRTKKNACSQESPHAKPNA